MEFTQLRTNKFLAALVNEGRLLIEVIQQIGDEGVLMKSKYILKSKIF